MKSEIFQATLEAQCPQCAGKGTVEIRFEGQNPAPSDWKGVWDYEQCRMCGGSGFVKEPQPEIENGAAARPNFAGRAARRIETNEGTQQL